MSFKDLYIEELGKKEGIPSDVLLRELSNSNELSEEDFSYLIILISSDDLKLNREKIIQLFSKLTLEDKQLVFNRIFSEMPRQNVLAFRMCVIEYNQKEIDLAFNAFSYLWNMNNLTFLEKTKLFIKSNRLIAAQGEFDRSPICMGFYLKNLSLAKSVLTTMDMGRLENIMAVELLCRITHQTAEIDDAFDLIDEMFERDDYIELYDKKLSLEECSFCLAIADDLLHDELDELLEKSLMSYSSSEMHKLANLTRTDNTSIDIDYVYYSLPWYQLGSTFFNNYFKDYQIALKDRTQALDLFKSGHNYSKYLETYGEPSNKNELDNCFNSTFR